MTRTDQTPDDARTGGADGAVAAAPSADDAVGKRAPGRRGERRLDPDTLAALEEERDFLLRSLDDLEREHAAGDVDDHDYATLKDDYTARAARAIRAIESHQARVAAARRPRSWRRTLATVAAVAAFAVLAGVLVAQASGRREAGDALTGEVRQSTREQLVAAHDLAARQRYDEAIEVYDEVLAGQPSNAEALAYRGWAQFWSGDASGAVDTLTSAIEADPEYPDTFAFLAIILDRAGAPDSALDALDRFDALDPPPAAQQLVGGLRARLEAEVGGTTRTTAPAGAAPSPPTTPVP
jgi:tetratricopeptide (TPR) repeat protein